MKILETKFVQGFIKMANDGYLQGWHERNGGNLSYRLKAEDSSSSECARRMDTDRNRSTGAGRRIFPCDRKRQIFQKYYC